MSACLHTVTPNVLGPANKQIHNYVTRIIQKKIASMDSVLTKSRIVLSIDPIIVLTVYMNIAYNGHCQFKSVLTTFYCNSNPNSKSIPFPKPPSNLPEAHSILHT